MNIGDVIERQYIRWSQRIFDRSPRQHVASIRRKIKQQNIPNRLDFIEPCIFVLSTGRTGTKTLAALGKLAANLLAYHEPSPLLFGLSRQAYLNSGNAVAENILTEAFYSARKDLLAYSSACGSGYIESSPQVTFLAPVIQKVLPQARFIHLIRRPHGVIQSGMRRSWYAGHESDSVRIEPQINSANIDAWPRYTPLQKNLWLWAETNQWIHNFCSQLPNEKTLLLRSEDIFAGEQAAMEQFYSFANSPLPSTRWVERVLKKQMNQEKQGAPNDIKRQVSLQKESVNADLLRFVQTVATTFNYEL